MRFEARETIPHWLPWMAVAGAGIGTLCFAAILIAAAGASPLVGFRELFIGAFGSRNAITETGATATPLIFTGLAAAIAFRAKLWNIGAEGQLYAGALAVTYFGTGLIELPPFLMIPFLLIVACVAGSLTLLPMVLLRQFMRVDEVVTTLLTNFVIILLVSYLLEGPWKDPYSLGHRVRPLLIPGAAAVMPRSRLHLGFAIAWFPRSSFGLYSHGLFWFSGKAVGLNSQQQGMPAFRLPKRLFASDC